MSTLDKSIITPSEASGIAQAAFDTVNSLLPFSNVFPMKSNDGQTTVSWTPVIPADATSAVDFRAWDAEVGYGVSTSKTAEEYTGLIPLSKKMHITERELIGHVGDTTYLRNKAEEHIDQLGTEAAIRAELARIEVAMNATYTINSKNLHNKYTFHRPNALDNLKPGDSKKWSDDSSTPLIDIENWVEAIKKQHGRVPGAAFTTSSVIDALRTNEEFRTALSGSSLTNSKTRLTRNEVLDVLRSEANLTDVRMIDVMYSDLERDHGIVLPVDINTLIPSNTFVMLPSFNDTSLGFTADGPTVEATDAEYGINKSVNDGLIACMLSDQAPVSYDVYVNGSLMPILVQAVSTAKATVL